MRELLETYFESKTALFAAMHQTFGCNVWGGLDDHRDDLWLWSGKSVWWGSEFQQADDDDPTYYEAAYKFDVVNKSCCCDGLTFMLVYDNGDEFWAVFDDSKQFKPPEVKVS